MNIESIRSYFKNKKMVFLGIVLFISTIILAITFTYRQVIIEVDNQEVQYSFNGNKTVGEVLKANKIAIKEEDVVQPAMNQVISDGEVINIDRAMPVHLFIDGEYLEIYTTEREVKKIIDEANIELDKKDIVTPDLNLIVNRGENIQVTRVNEELETTETVLEYKEIQRENQSMDKGKSRIVQEGKNGLKTIIEKVVYHDGTEFSRAVIDEKIIAPIDQIKEIGTKVQLMASSTTSNKPIAGRKITITATAYCSCYKCCAPYDGTTTASGTSPKAGRTIAASKDYSFGTEVYIPYFDKVFVVEDRGGAIQGNKIDIYFNTHEEALQFGRRTLEAQIVQ